MKLTDLALIFIGIFLPVVIIVYVNTSFVIKSEKQEMYYKNMMNSAINDAVSSMKHIENEDEEIDYGYSGIVDKKVSINANTAITTFYNSLANNFNIANNQSQIDSLKMYIPVVAILDYDGIYIHSAERLESGDISFITKPKVYYTYSYVLTETQDPSTRKREYNIVNVNSVDNILTEQILSNHIYQINFTMDDYVTLNIYEITSNGTIGKIVYTKGFYLTDSSNNTYLVHEDIEGIISSERNALKNNVVEHLGKIKQNVIAEIGMREISYAVNKHNDYAGQAGITYTFRFSVESDQVWYETMDGIGMIAIIQGISLGNRYLNYKAYSAADLIATTKYYVSKGATIEGKDLGYLERDLYHSSDKCKAYLAYKNSTNDKIVPSFYTIKAQAATQGYYPCPICKP